MKILNNQSIQSVSGGVNLTCKEALIKDVTDFDFDLEPSQYCTKEQFTTYALAMVDLAYSKKWVGANQADDQFMINIINGLNL